VTNFAKKTGDYGSLSAVDMKVMALTHQLFCEQESEKIAELRAVPAREVHKLAGGWGMTVIVISSIVVVVIEEISSPY